LKEYHMAKKSTGIALASPDDNWQTQRDLETMIESEAIENDPKRLKAVQALAKKKMLDMAALASEGKDD
jgi:hypothetical protein